MEKRLFLAIALSLIVLTSWSYFASKSQPIDNKTVTSQAPAVVYKEPVAVSTPAVVPSPVPSFAPLRLNQEKREIIFDVSRAAVESVIFKNYQSYKFPLKSGFVLAGENLVFKKSASSNQGVVFVHSDANKDIKKEFICSNSNYGMELEITIHNKSSVPIKTPLNIVLGILDFKINAADAHLMSATLISPEKNLHVNGHKDLTLNNLQFLGLRDRYFSAIIEPVAAKDYSGMIKKLNSHESEISLSSQELNINPGQEWKQAFRIYLGPQELGLIGQVDEHWQAVMNFGVFDFISHIILQVLQGIYNLVHNWGWAIVILSVGIYLLLYPLMIKQMHSMKQMQALQPVIQQLRQANKNNPQKLNKEIMELYKKNKINPLGGCLPLVLQIPIFFALYQVLIRSVALKGAHFLWIKDLASPDRLFILPTNIPILGNEINILPILMTIGMFFQQKMSMAGAAGEAAEQQKIMLIVMPLMFGFIFYRMPSGLVLYWFINSALMLVQQWRASHVKCQIV